MLLLSLSTSLTHALRRTHTHMTTRQAQVQAATLRNLLAHFHAPSTDTASASALSSAAASAVVVVVFQLLLHAVCLISHLFLLHMHTQPHICSQASKQTNTHASTGSTRTAAAALLSSLSSLHSPALHFPLYLSTLPRSFDLVIVAILITNTSMKETTLPLPLPMPLLPALPLPLPVPLFRPLPLSTAAQQQQQQNI